MTPKVDLKEMNERIQLMKRAAQELRQMADGFPALDRNTSRILASIKMLEINISDLVEIA
jgi:hypothetical protein